MRAISLWLLAVASAKASFLRDVVRTNEAFDENQIRHALLGKAVPLEEYRIDLRSRGLDLEGDFRELQNNGADDYYTNEAYMNNFTGYSLKYAACQPVQRFSEDAILAGEYSPFVTDDIIILRLCPSSTCNSKRILGCTSKYIDYAISISDYIRIMLRYKMDKAQKLCYWCTSCLEERRMEDAAAGDDAVVAGDDAAQVTDDAGQVAVAADDGVQDAGDDDAAAAAAGDDGGAAGDDGGAAGDDGGAAAAGDDAGDDVTNEEQYSSSCPNFQSLCYPNGVSVCNANGDDATDDSSSSHLATEGYLNYLDCNHIDGYYVRPRCNGYDQSITMGVYYDKFCSQYAGDKVNLNSVLGNLGIEAYAFREFVTINTCIDCAESVRIIGYIIGLILSCRLEPLFSLLYVFVCFVINRILVHTIAPTPICAIVCIRLLPLVPLRVWWMYSTTVPTKSMVNAPFWKWFEREPTTKKVECTRNAQSVVMSQTDKSMVSHYR